MPFRDFFDAYVTCALWSSTDDNGEPLDANYSRDDIGAQSLAEMERECRDFYDSALALHAPEYGHPEYSDDALAGHDFWLTRNGHGAGFWDRGLGDVGDKLTAACKPYGPCDLYVGDDGIVVLGS